MKKSLLLLLIIILCLAKEKQCFAQNFADKAYYLVDSLDLNALTEDDKKLIETSLKEYHIAKDDTSKINAIIDIVEESFDDNVYPKYNLWIYRFVQKSLLAHPSPRIKKRLLLFLAGSLNNMGYVYNIKGEIPKALEYYHKSLKISEEIDDKEGVASSFNNIGMLHSSQGEISKALEYLQKSFKLREDIEDKEGVAMCLNNIGFIYNNQGDFLNAIEYYQKSVKISEEIGNYFGVANTLSNIGFIYNKQGDFLNAIEHYQKSVKISEEIGYKKGVASTLMGIGFSYYNQGNIINAHEYGIKSLTIAREIGYPEEIKNAANLLNRVYQKQAKYKEALEMRNLEIQMRDSINNEATQKATAQQQAKYEYEKQKTIDDADHDKQIALEQEEQKKQRIISISIGAGLVLLVVFLLFVFNRLRVTRKQKVVIEQQRDEVEEAHKEIRDSINYAERIQRSFLATDELLNNNLKDYFVFFQPKDVVSGDFYWAGKLANNQFAIVNADSTGHGVPGAIMSILNISSIEKAIDNNLVKPADIFNHTRDTIIERLSKDGSEEGGKDGMDASIIAFDFENNKFSYTAAQNPIWVIRNNELIEIKAEKMPIGKHDNDSTPFVGGEFEIQKGDVIYSITDGFQDQFGGEKGKKFKVKPFKDYLISIAHLTMQEQREKLYKTFSKWKGEEEQVDDVCVIGVRV